VNDAVNHTKLLIDALREQVINFRDDNARLLDLLRKCRDYICQIPPGSYPRIDEQKHGEFIAEITTALELERGIE